MPTIDVHTHVYPPSYISLLRSRTTVPYIRTFPDAPDDLRLIILPGEDSNDATTTSRGRPIGPSYYDINAKLAFMNAHHIHTSIISLANPWLDFLPPHAAPAAATTINNDLEALCCAPSSTNRLYFFATLPLTAPTPSILAEITRITTSLPHARGIILGTSGLGAGLDDPRLDPIWAALQAAALLVFLHPHYGLPADVYGPREYGHVLPLAIGFPVETTIALARMLLGGVWERHRGLQVLVAHSGGTLPFLAGRIESCIAHDAYLKKEGRVEKMRSVWEVLRKNVYLDAVVYSEVGLKAAVEASGADRLMFGEGFSTTALCLWEKLLMRDRYGSSFLPSLGWGGDGVVERQDKLRSYQVCVCRRRGCG